MNSGLTPLDVAAQEGRIDAAQVLFEAMGEFSSKEKEGLIFKSIAVANRHKKTACAQYLLSLLEELSEEELP